MPFKLLSLLPSKQEVNNTVATATAPKDLSFFIFRFFIFMLLVFVSYQIKNRTGNRLADLH